MRDLDLCLELNQFRLVAFVIGDSVFTAGKQVEKFVKFGPCLTIGVSDPVCLGVGRQRPDVIGGKMSPREIASHVAFCSLISSSARSTG